MEFFCCMIACLPTRPLLRRLLRLNVTRPHPPYLPDLAPSDFSLFPLMKEHFSGTYFSSDNDVIASVEVFLQGQDELFYKTGIQKLQK